MPNVYSNQDVYQNPGICPKQTKLLPVLRVVLEAHLLVGYEIHSEIQTTGPTKLKHSLK